MVEFQGICEQVHSPLLPLPAQHGLQLLLIEAAQGVQRQHLLEASPVPIAPPVSLALSTIKGQPSIHGKHQTASRNAASTNSQR